MNPALVLTAMTVFLSVQEPVKPQLDPRQLAEPQEQAANDIQPPAPGVLRELFRDFEILDYREVDDYGDWGGPPTGHVRMIARKLTLRPRYPFPSPT